MVTVKVPPMLRNPRKMTAIIPWVLASLLCAFVLLSATACSNEKAKPAITQNTAPAVPTPPRVTRDRKDLFYRFKDPKTGKYQTVNTFEDIPESQRHEVVIYDPTHDLPGWFFVANLTVAEPDGTFPCVARPSSEMGSKTRVKSGGVTSYAKSDAKTIRFYTASWCGVCQKARSFLQKEKLPYVEKDIEKDPTAKRELEQAAKRAGVPASKLNGVPIFVIGKEVLTGFDANRVRQLAQTK